MKIKNNVSWVGKVDWEIREFHGHELTTRHGSTYNSYLIQEEKTVLIDAVAAPFAQEFVENLEKIIDLDKIDYVVANHAEMDHSGALPELMRRIPDKPIYCSPSGVSSLKGHYHQDWDLHPVKTGEKIAIGNGKELIFIGAPLLHWPDSMFTYLTGDNVLFPNDAFGQHYATEGLFNDLADQDILWEEAMKYYANILNCFSPLVDKKIKEFVALDLPVDMICPSHGVVWRDNPLQVVDKYAAWADAYQEDQAAIIYDTMWNATRVMAEEIVRGIESADPKVNIKLFNIATADVNDVITEIFRSKLVLIGSPTINGGILRDLAALLEEVKGLKFVNKKAAAFGSYGWSGEAVGQISSRLKEAGFILCNEGLRTIWQPDEKARQQAREWGEKLKVESL